MLTKERPAASELRAVEQRPAAAPTRPARALLVASVLSYLVATAIGVSMRFGFAGSGFPLPFDQMLHSHSHTLYFGWAGLAILAGLTAWSSAYGAGQRRLTMLLIAMTPPLLFGFLALGYHTVTIAVSTVIMLAWYGVAAYWLAGVRGRADLATHTMRWGVRYLIAASCGVWTLAVLQASGAGTPFTESLAVHAFLICFAWFTVLAVVALLVQRAHELHLRLHEPTVRRIVSWWAAIAWMTFPLSVAGGAETPWIGPLARLGGVALILPGLVWAGLLWSASPEGRMGRPLRAAAAWFAAATFMSGTIAAFGTDVIRLGTRQGVIIYLHALFVGFVTTGLVVVLGGGRAVRALDLHAVSLAVMLVGLVLVPAGYARWGFDLAAISSVPLWLAGLLWSFALVRGAESG